LMLRRHLDGEIGTTRRVLTEAGGTGRTEHFTPVLLAAPVAPGNILDLKMAAHDGKQLLAA
jgi:threonylcarbamoyladenosine tRNA methylthiotransferase MtaB